MQVIKRFFTPQASHNAQGISNEDKAELEIAFWINMSR